MIMIILIIMLLIIILSYGYCLVSVKFIVIKLQLELNCWLNSSSTIKTLVGPHAWPITDGGLAKCCGSLLQR